MADLETKNGRKLNWLAVTQIVLILAVPAIGYGFRKIDTSLDDAAVRLTEIEAWAKQTKENRFKDSDGSALETRLHEWVERRYPPPTLTKKVDDIAATQKEDSRRVGHIEGKVELILAILNEIREK